MNFIGSLLETREFRYVDWDDKTGKGTQVADHWTLANLISSIPSSPNFRKGYHLPVIDLDLDCSLIPSSTPGHYHLYVNQLITHDNYKKLLEAMVECGIVQHGILEQFNREGFTCVRLPWVSKAQGDRAYPDRKPIVFNQI